MRKVKEKQKLSWFFMISSLFFNILLHLRDFLLKLINLGKRNTKLILMNSFFAIIYQKVTLIKSINLLQKIIINQIWIPKICQSKRYLLLKQANLLPISKSHLQNFKIKGTMLPSFVSSIFLAQWIVKQLKVNQNNLTVSADWILSNILWIQSFIR